MRRVFIFFPWFCFSLFCSQYSFSNDQHLFEKLSDRNVLNIILRKADQFNAQELSNILCALAQLKENGVDIDSDSSEKTVTALLKAVPTQADKFNAQGINNGIWALAQLKEDGVAFNLNSWNGAVTALLKSVFPQVDEFNGQDIGNSLWALIKLKENGVAFNPDLLEETVNMLQEEVLQRDEFNTQETGNILSALAQLKDDVTFNPDAQIPESTPSYEKIQSIHQSIHEHVYSPFKPRLQQDFSLSQLLEDLKNSD